MSRWTYRWAICVSFAGLLVGRATDPPNDAAKLAEPRKKPITTAKGEIGDLLTKWWADGTAAGNVGDFYDNRDGGHSDLDTAPYPQLQRIVYSDDDVKNHRHWALTVATRPHVTFGNSSTSAPPTLGGSNPRHAYCSTEALELLARQYRGNNVYIYPEHRDHHPGHNGKGDFFGDLYPTNTPYLITSQGSSGSDQPFMRTIPFTLAAFHPEVKKKLVDNGLLMPTLQMILRSTNKHLADPKEYLTGKAHPSVFEGSWVDALKMVKLAHEITADTIPPLVQLKVLEEDRPVNGRDFFEPPGVTEKLADTPAVIARIWRGTANRRRMIVSAADSFDVNKKPLTFTWVVLRGDDKQITITPRNKAGSEVEIVVPYHPRRPVLPGSPLESNRVDIGVFVHNGAYYSAPGFVTYCTLDNECRAYDEKGRVVEIGYGVGEVEVRVSDYAELDKAMSSEGGMAAKVFKLTAEERDTFENHGRIYRRSAPVMASLREKTKTHEAARAALDVELKQARAKLDAAQKTHAAKPSEESKAALADWTKTVERIVDLRKRFDDELVKVRKATADVQKAIDLSQATVDEFVIPFLKNAWRDPALVADHYEVFLAELKKASQVRKVTVQTELKRLFELGFLTNPDGGELEWQRIRKNFTPFQRFAIERFNATLLAELVLPGALTVSASPNYVDYRLFAPKSWRDVYHYDDAGALTGWTRYDSGRVTDFTEEGLMVVEKDDKGRPIKAGSVRYRQAAAKEPWRPNPLEMTPGDEIVTYGYESGRRVEKTRTRAKE